MQFPSQITTPVGAISTEQNKVLRNTYMMLALTMIPTVIGAFIGMSISFAFMAEHPIMGALGMSRNYATACGESPHCSVSP
jgi:modulator of FtsH protease